MSNQRQRSTYRAASSDSLADMKLRDFFREAAGILNQAGEEDAAFYFEQVVDHLNQGKPLPQDYTALSRMFGV